MQMIQVKYKSKPFITLNEPDLLLTAKVLLLKINVITGWVLPDENMDALVDVFAKKMILSYPNVNQDEVEYAFITEGTTVKDWGKYLNIGLIDEVMIPYTSKRFEVSRIEEQIKSKPKQIEQKEDLGEKAMDDWFKDVFKKLEQGNYPVEFIPLALYEWMDKNGNIPTSAAEKKEYLAKAVNYRFQLLTSLYEKNDAEFNKKMIDDFVKMKNTGIFIGDEIERIKSLAKKMILFDLIKNKIKN